MRNFRVADTLACAASYAVEKAPAAWDSLGGGVSTLMPADTPWDWLDAPVARPSVVLAVTAGLQAWSPADPAAVRSLYSPDAVLVDALQRVELSGADAIVAHARSTASDATSLTVREGGSTLGPTEPTGKAVFFRWLYNTWSQPEDVEVLVLYTATTAAAARARPRSHCGSSAV